MKSKNMYAAATGMNASNATPTKAESSEQFKEPGYNPGEFEMNDHKPDDTMNCAEHEYSESQIGKLKEELYGLEE